MRFLAGLGLVGILSGCDIGATQAPNIDLRDLPATFTLRVGEERQIGETVVRFAAVLGDSRCPSDVVCAWQGNAELEFAVGPADGRGPSFQLRLNTALEPRTGTARGLGVTVVGLAPTPVSTRATRGYRVELRVEAVTD